MPAEQKLSSQAERRIAVWIKIQERLDMDDLKENKVLSKLVS